MAILVTAFGPFAGRSENASTLALRELKRRIPKLRTRVLPVDAVIAPSRLKQAIRHLQPDVLILLGEAAGSKAIRLESTAWNELDFRIPDIAGRLITSRPIRLITSRPIRRDGPPSASSTLPLVEIHSALDAADHSVSISHDSGRYLCNQLFYQTLDHLACHGIHIPAGFIHLPLAHDYPTPRAADALEIIVRLSTSALF